MRSTVLFALFTLLSIDAGAAIRGSILTAEGQPIPSAYVQLYVIEGHQQRMSRLRSDEYAPKPLARALSDARGNFSIEAPEDSHLVRVQITRDGFAPASAFATSDFDLAGVVLEPVNETTGTITDHGQPAAAATVRFEGHDGSEWVARTDEKGRYKVPDLAGWARRVTVVTSDGFVWDELSGKTDLSANRALRRAQTITGSLVKADGTTPAPGARIFLDGPTVGETAEDGSFRIADPPQGWKRIDFLTEDGWATRKSSAQPALGTVRLGTPAAVHGSVRSDVDGIPGVRISLSPDAPSPGSAGVPEYEVVSDSRGGFALSPVAPGRYRIQASHPLFEIAESVVDVAPGGPVDHSIAAALRPLVTGHVVTEGGQPVAAASVLPKMDPRVRLKNATRSARSWSASDGRFVTRLVPPAEPTVLEARKRSFPVGVSEPVRATVQQPLTGVRITIPLGFAVSGRISDEFGSPIAGVTLAANGLRAEGNRLIVLSGERGEDDAVRSDAEGRFVIRLTRGRWSITAGDDRWAYVTRNDVEVSGNTENIDFVLRPAVALRGRVVRKGSGGIPDARVSVMQPGTATRSALTGADGRFEITGLSPGSSTVMVDKPEETLREMRMTTIPQDDLLFEFPPGATLRGRVVDARSETPVKAFTIAISADRSEGGAVARSQIPVVRPFASETGEFVLEHVTSNPAELLVRAPRYVEKRVRGVEAAEGEAREELLIELERGTMVSGHVTDESGIGLSGVRVSRVEQSRFVAPPAVGGRPLTDADGRYEAGPFDGEMVTLRFDRDGYRAEVRDVELDRERVTADVRLTRGATISGQVVTEFGAPVAGASVSWAGLGPFDGNSVTSDSSGMFRIEGVGEEKIRVTAEKSGYVPAAEDVDPAAGRTLRLVLAEGGTVSGLVRGLSPSELPGIRVEVRSGGTVKSAPADQSGSFRVEGVRPGTASVTAGWMKLGSGRSSRVRTVQVSQGAEAWVEIDMSGGYRISGEVTLHGMPASDMVVTFIPSDPLVRTHSSATTDAMGRYSADGLEAGRYRVGAVRFGMSSVSWQGEYAVGGDGRFDIDIRGVTIEGRVIDVSTGRGVEGAALEIRSAAGSGVTFPGRGPESGVDGSFAFRDITPGTWTIRASARGLGSTSETIDIGSTGARIELRLSPSEGTVLRIVDAATGAPIPAFVSARDASGVVVYDQMVQPGGDGTIRLPLAVGSYQVLVIAPGYAGRTIQAQSPSSAITVPLSRGGTLNVNVSGGETLRARVVEAGSGEPAIGTPGGLIALMPGVTVLRNVPSGTIRIDVIGESGSVDRSVTVSVPEGGSAAVSL